MTQKGQRARERWRAVRARSCTVMRELEAAASCGRCAQRLPRVQYARNAQRPPTPPTDTERCLRTQTGQRARERWRAVRACGGGGLVAGIGPIGACASKSGAICTHAVGRGRAHLRSQLAPSGPSGSARLENPTAAAVRAVGNDREPRLHSSDRHKTPKIAEFATFSISKPAEFAEAMLRAAAEIAPVVPRPKPTSPDARDPGYPPSQHPPLPPKWGW